MAVTKIKALDQFSHGRLSMAVGDTDTIEAVEARDLVKARLVEIVEDDPAPAPDAEPEPTAGDTDAVDGGAKMVDEPKNKMAEAPMNKAHKMKVK